MGRFDALTQPTTPKEASSHKPQLSPTPKPHVEQPIKQEAHQSISQSTTRSPRQSTKRSTKQPMNQSTTKIVEKPKGFYITQRLDTKLDEAVRYLQEVHGIKKADRSTIVNAILDTEANWTEKALDRLVDRVISVLTSRLMG
jgi:hypothetical protein